MNLFNLKWAPDVYSDALLQSAITILKEDTMKNQRKARTSRKNEGPMNATPNPIDNPVGDVVQSDSTIFQSTKEDTMSYEDTIDDTASEDTIDDTASEDTIDDTASEYTEVINPLPKHEPTKQELKAAAALEKIAAAAEKLAAKEAAAAEKLAAKEAAAAEKLAAKEAKKEAAELAKTEKLAAKLEAIQSKNVRTKEEREAAKLERQARLAALDPDGTKKYHGSMLALADRVKQGAYVKGATGQLRSTNELAEILDAVPVGNVIQLAKIVLELPENPYTNLNSGQQSMNLRNRMRGAIKKGTLTLDAIRDCIEENGFATATDWAAIAEEKRAKREANAAAAKAEKEAKAAAKAEKEAKAAAKAVTTAE